MQESAANQGQTYTRGSGRITYCAFTLCAAIQLPNPSANEHGYIASHLQQLMVAQEL